MGHSDIAQGSQLVTVDDLLLLNERLWPHVTFYDKQVEVIESTMNNDETYVPAGNQLGKDFVAAFIALASFLVCYAKKVHCRILTTSVAERHLDVLWGEIGRFVMSSKVPLIYNPVTNPGGCLIVNHQAIRRAEEGEKTNPFNYLIGIVYENPDKMAGHHAEWNLVIGDECSGLDDVAYDRFQGWAKRKLFIGNCNDCNNFFRRGIEAGSLAA